MDNFIIQRNDPARLLFVKIAIKVDPLVVDAVVRSLQSTSPSIKRQWLRGKIEVPDVATSTVNDEWRKLIIEHLSNAVQLQTAANAQCCLVNGTSSLAQQCAYVHDIYAHEARLASLLAQFRTSSIFGSMLNDVLKPIQLSDGTLVMPIATTKNVADALKKLKAINPSNMGLTNPRRCVYFEDYSVSAMSVGTTDNIDHLATLLECNLMNGEYKNWHDEWNSNLLASGVLAGRLYRISGVTEFTAEGGWADVEASSLLALPRGLDGRALSSNAQTTILSVNDDDVVDWWFNAFKIQERVPFKGHAGKEASK